MGDSEKHEVNPPDQCNGCGTGKITAVRAKRDRPECEPCSTVQISNPRFNYCYDRWCEKNPYKAAFVKADIAGYWRSRSN